MKATRGVAIACAGVAMLSAGACTNPDHAKATNSAVAGQSSSPPPLKPPTIMLEASSPPIPPDAATRFGTLVGHWQAAQSTFVRRTASSSEFSAAGRQAAATFLTAERRFADALDPAQWPARAAGSVRALRTASIAEQRNLRAITTAVGQSEYARRLAVYRTGVAAEKRAIRTVRQALT